MDTPAILAKITGLVLFFFTARSVYKHFKSKRNRGQDKPKKAEHSKVEYVLNAFLLYAWFVFMTAFSLGMILNN